MSLAAVTAGGVLRKYASVVVLGLQDTFVYRWNFLLRALFSVVPLLGTVYIWRAVFASRGGDISGYDAKEMIFYFLLTMLVENLVTPTEDEWRIAAEIRDGQISALITKPLNHLAYRMSLFISYRALYTVVILPVLAAIFYAFREYLRLPAHFVTWPAFLVSIGMAAMIQFFIAYALAMMAFWILEISTVVFFFYSFEYLLSGQLFPLDIMPGWMQGFVQWSPFTYELFFPVQIYLERVQGAALLRGLGVQFGWMLLTFGLARFLWSRGVRKYQAVGG
jgi:ABC-2 type transport system permease protein